jgi:hypothetical protein
VAIDTPSLIVSVAALAVSIWTGFVTYRLARRQTTLQERLLSLENSRERDRRVESSTARVRASIGHPLKSSWYLRVVNEGPSEARAITMQVDGLPILDHPLVPKGAPEIRHLGPGAHGQYPLAVHMGVEPKLLVQLAWEDQSGRPGTWTSELSIF